MRHFHFQKEILDSPALFDIIYLMSDTVIIRCDQCNALNRILKSRLQDNPVCGKCKSRLHFDSSPVEAGDANFDSLVLRSSVPLVVVDFYAAWCGPCKMFTPVFQEFARIHAGEARAVKIDVDRNPGVTARYGIQSMPTLVIFKNGQEVKRISGALTAPQLENLISPFLS